MFHKLKKVRFSSIISGIKLFGPILLFLCLEISSLFYLDSISKVVPICSGHLIEKIIIYDWSYMGSTMFFGFVIGIVLMIFCLFILYSMSIPVKLTSPLNAIKGICILLFFKVILPVIVIFISYTTFQLLLNIPYKVELSYDNVSHNLTLKKNFLILKKNITGKMILDDQYWLEMNNYDDGQVGSDRGPDIGRCGIFSKKGRGPILFEGTPKLALSACNYLSQMTGLCSLQKFWVGRRLENCKLLNAGINSNCVCDN